LVIPVRGGGQDWPFEDAADLLAQLAPIFPSVPR